MHIPFPVFHTEGEYQRQAHTMMDGAYEREKGREGFTDAVTHFYHRRPPMAFTDIDGPGRPRLYNLNEYTDTANRPLDGRLMFHNATCRFTIWRTDQDMTELYRNADGDDLLFLHEGEGDFFCDYGHLKCTAGDYIVVPRGTAWRIEVDKPVMMLILEATNDYFRLPDRGLMGVNALFDPGVMDIPKINNAFKSQKDDPTTLVIKRLNEVTRVNFPYNPLDAVGWKGNVMVQRLNWRDIRPVMSERYHMPPSAHSLFMTPKIYVGTFAPRPQESSPDALKTSFFHNNEDWDEVGFLHHGDFMSKDGVETGILFYHPSGINHGPHPGAYFKADAGERRYSDEVLFFFETRDPLQRADLPEGIENPDFIKSWAGWRDYI